MQPIPLIDIRHTGPGALVAAHPEKARALIHASKNIYGMASRIASQLALPIGDFASHQWLQRTENPYYEEIRDYAQQLKLRGVYALNLCYEWGCTSGAYAAPDGVYLSRVLDWPFPALGEHLVVAHQSGEAGDFYNVTWPGVAGVFNAMAPGRFSAALNQAPMRRYGATMPIDWVRNRAAVKRNAGLPPAHLLRMVFEQAGSYAAAKEMLCQVPVAIPVIYILAGVGTQEGCVIERLEDAYAVREMVNGSACAANHFESAFKESGHGWSSRGADSVGRRHAASRVDAEVLMNDFAWFQAPIANKDSRLAMVASASNATLRLMGTDGTKPVSAIFHVSTRQ